MKDHKSQIKFVYNFHSNGNMWVFPYNGRDNNDIETRSPGVIQIFLEIGNDASFPKNEKNYGNSHDLLGEKIGGDMDDWILGTLNIPSVTAELGLQEQYIDSWQIKDKETALQIMEENEPWLEHTYQKIGCQVNLKPVYYKS